MGIRGLALFLNQEKNRAELKPWEDWHCMRPLIFYACVCLHGCKRLQCSLVCPCLLVCISITVCKYRMNVYVCVCLQDLSHLIWSQTLAWLACAPLLSELSLIVAWPARIKWAAVPLTDKPWTGCPCRPLAAWAAVAGPFAYLDAMDEHGNKHRNCVNSLLK